MSYLVQMGLHENEKHIPKNSWTSKNAKNNSATYARYSKKLNTPKQPKSPKVPKVKHGAVTKTIKTKGERKNARKNNTSNNRLSALARASSSTLAMYNPASYFQYSSPSPSSSTAYSTYSSGSSSVHSGYKHKVRVIGTSPPSPRQQKKDKKEESAAQYERPKFEPHVEPIVRNTRLDHSYFVGASDPIPPPINTSVNGLNSLKYQHVPPTPSSPSPHSLPILNQLPSSKSVFGIARASSPPSKPLPQSASYLVPQHSLMPHHLLSLMSSKATSQGASQTQHQGRHSDSSGEEDNRDPDPHGEDTETAPENGEEEEDDRRKQDAPKPAPVDSNSATGGAVDDSVTRCVCGFLHDDGYMICCDQCFVWQHVDCMEIDRQNIPDEYLCEECSPRRVDKMKAIGIQIQKIKRLTDKTMNNNDDDANSDSSHSSQERPRQRGGGKRGQNKGKPRGKRGPNATTTGVRRRKSSTAQVTPPAAKRQKSSSGGPGGLSSPSPAPQSPHPSTPNMNHILHSNNKRKMITVAEKKQTPGKNNTKVLSPLNHAKLSSLNDRIADKKNNAATKRMGKKQQEKKFLNNNNNHKRKNNSLLLSTSEARTPEPPVKKEAPVPPISSDEEDNKPMSRWIDNYEEATCNYYAPDLRARIASIKLNGSHQDVKLPASLLSSTVQKCRASLLSSGTKILVTSTNMSTNQALIELRGRYLLVSGDRKNVPSPGQHVFFYAMQHEGIDIIIDCKTYGNDARFVRRSCKPNAVMKHCIDKGSIHIYLTALYSVAKNSEVTVSFASGGNPEQCTCNDKATCTASEQKTKHYSERKHQIVSSAELPPSSPVRSPSPVPPPVALPTPPPSTEDKEEADVKDTSLVQPPSEPSESIEPAKTEPAPETPSLGTATPVKKEKDVKPPVSTKDEKIRKLSLAEEKRKSSTSDCEFSEKPLSETCTKKESDEKKSQPPSSTTRRKKSSVPNVGKRKYSESSQSLESDNTEDEEVTTRRGSTSKATPSKGTVTPSNTPTKLSREERKLEAIMRAFEKMEKSASRQKESRVRKNSTTVTINEKTEESATRTPQVQAGKANRRIVRKRKGRSKSFSVTICNTRSRRGAITRGNSAQKDEDSSSGEEDEDVESSSDNSLPLSNVQTPSPSFKLPFTRRGREEQPDPESPEKPAGGCAKKRWLRQAISEECDLSPRSDSPTPQGESAGPLKKRRLARASLSSPTQDDDCDDVTPTPSSTITPKAAYACLIAPSPVSTIIEAGDGKKEEPVGSKEPLTPEKSTEDQPESVDTTTVPNTNPIDTPILPEVITPEPTVLSNASLESPAALESTLQNSRDFSMPLPPPSSFYMSPWSGAPSPSVTAPSPPLPVVEKQITKRKLSISEYRQRKGTALASSTNTAQMPPPLTSRHIESEVDEKTKTPCSPPTSSSSDEESSMSSHHNNVNVGATRVIEKSVLVDNLIAKISKSADTLVDNKDFKDAMFTRIPKTPPVINNNQVKQPKPDSFLERPKENLLERLNREFNIRLNEGLPLNLPKPTPPLPPGVMPSAPVVEYEDLTSDLYIPIASRSHTPRLAKK